MIVGWIRTIQPWLSMTETRVTGSTGRANCRKGRAPNGFACSTLMRTLAAPMLKKLPAWVLTASSSVTSRQDWSDRSWYSKVWL